MYNTTRIRIYAIITIFGLISFPYLSFSQSFNNDSININDSTLAYAKAKMNQLPTNLFLKGIYKKDSSTIRYRFLFPDTIIKNVKYPLIITLHNSSRVGQDNEAQLEPLARIWVQPNVRTKFKAFVLAPQFSHRSSVYSTDSATQIIQSSPSSDVKSLYSLIKELERQHPEIDKKRIYVVGYSMGASTAQNLAALNQSHFAAIVSIAAVPDYLHTKSFKKLPIWLIHGKLDTDNPYQGSLKLFQRISNNKQVRFSSYEFLTHHNIMVPFINNEVVPQWLFNQHK